jgi:hypothetical protein
MAVHAAGLTPPLHDRWSLAVSVSPARAAGGLAIHYLAAHVLAVPVYEGHTLAVPFLADGSPPAQRAVGRP